MGYNHPLVPGGVGGGVGEVVFEEGKEVRWAEAFLPLCDGVVIVDEGGSGRDDDDGGEEGQETKKQWWSKGVNLHVYLRSDIMRRLMEDEGLRAFAEGE